MTKEEAIDNFLKGLRIVLNNASAYFKEHPYYVKSVHAFKEQLDPLFGYLNPIQISFTPNSLFIDGKYWEKKPLYTELASIFHLRKIKSIEFRQGVSAEELVEVFNCVSLPVKDIFKKGGFQSILNKEKIAHVTCEELDYSMLLSAEGEESADLWAYLFSSAVAKEDSAKITEVADGFDNITKKIKPGDLLENQELRDNVFNFLNYLKIHQKDKFGKCSRAVFKFLLKNKIALQDSRIDKIKGLMGDFTNEELAELLLEQVSADANFDLLSLKLFSQFADEDRHKEIAAYLAKKSHEQRLAIPTDRVKELLSVSGNEVIPTTYRDALAGMLKNVSLDKGLSFDRKALRDNYRYILLGMISGENNREKASLASGKIKTELQLIIAESGFSFLSDLLNILKSGPGAGSRISPVSEDLIKYIYGLVESSVCEGLIDKDLVLLTESIPSSNLSADFYLNKIFQEGKVNSFALKLFFKFFPNQFPLFSRNLESKISDIEFIEKLIKNIGEVERPFNLEVLKKIYDLSGHIIKIDVLKTMQALPDSDTEFLFSVLRTGDTLLKKEALAILSRDQANAKGALDILFSISSPFGSNDKVIIENIRVIENIKFKEAEDYLVALSGKNIFFHWELRKQAGQLLKKWHEG